MTEDQVFERGSALIDFDPPQFLLSNETLSHIAETFVHHKKVESEYLTQKERAISIGISFAVSIFCSYEAIFKNIPDSSNMSEFVFYICRVLLIAGVATWLIICTYKCFKSKKDAKAVSLNIQGEMKNAAKEDIKYTAILIIATQGSDQRFKIFVDNDRSGGHAFFLPYCSMNEKSSIDYQVGRIKKFLCSHYKLNREDILDIISLSEVPIYSIKSTRSGKAEAQHAFVFYRICLMPSAKHIFNNYDYGQWCTIEELKKNPEAIERNSDIIGKLDECQGDYIAESFEGRKKPPLKIIWNITKECCYGCKICATHDDGREELPLDKKLRALQSILTIKNRIGILDFAGGDPCTSQESLLIIQTAIYALGNNHISVTTTGKGIAKLPAEQRKALLKQCEITIDAEHANSSAVVNRAADGYVKENIEQLVLYADEATNLTINVPIIHTDLTEEEISNIVQEIVNIKERNKNSKIRVTFIRLMPVGLAKNLTYPNPYSPKNVINQIRTGLAPYGIECSSHCSLNVCMNDEHGDGCGRLTIKLGIDCAGNVFACAWAGYLTPYDKDKIEENPFYIGNLLDMNLIDLLNEQKNQNKNFRKMCKYNPKTFSFCPLISYVENKVDPHRNSDPLSESAIDISKQQETSFIEPDNN